MYGRGSHDKLTESGDWREKIVLTEHRYMREDVGIGLAFLASVAALVGVAVPLINAFLALGSAICAQDFKRSGRSLAGLGLGDLSLPDLKALLAGGFR
jgi:opine dehydrogenase